MFKKLKRLNTTKAAHPITFHIYVLEFSEKAATTTGLTAPGQKVVVAVVKKGVVKATTGLLDVPASTSTSSTSASTSGGASKGSKVINVNDSLVMNSTLYKDANGKFLDKNLELVVKDKTNNEIGKIEVNIADFGTPSSSNKTYKIVRSGSKLEATIELNVTVGAANSVTDDDESECSSATGEVGGTSSSIRIRSMASHQVDDGSDNQALRMKLEQALVETDNLEAINKDAATQIASLQEEAKRLRLIRDSEHEEWSKKYKEICVDNEALKLSNGELNAKLVEMTGELQNLAQLAATESQQMIVATDLKIQQLEVQLAEARADAEAEKRKYKGMESEIMDDVKELQVTLEASAVNVDTLTTELASSNAKIGCLEHDLAVSDQLLNDAQREAHEASQEVERLRKRLQDEGVRSDEANKQIIQLTATSTASAGLNTELNDAADQCRLLQTELEACREELSKSVAEASRYEPALMETSRKLDDLERKVLAFEAAEETHRKHEQQSELETAVLVADLQAARLEVESLLKGNRALEVSAQEQGAELQRTQEDLRTQSSRIESIQTEADAHRSQCESSSASEASAVQELLRDKEAAHRLAVDALVEKYSSEIAELQQQYITLQSQQDELVLKHQVETERLSNETEVACQARKSAESTLSESISKFDAERLLSDKSLADEKHRVAELQAHIDTSGNMDSKLQQLTDDNAEMREQLSQSHDRVQTLKDELAEQTTARDADSHEAALLNERISAKLSEAEIQITSLNIQLTEMEAANEHLRETIEQQRVEIITKDEVFDNLREEAKSQATAASNEITILQTQIKQIESTVSRDSIDAAKKCAAFEAQIGGLSTELSKRSSQMEVLTEDIKNEHQRRITAEKSLREQHEKSEEDLITVQNLLLCEQQNTTRLSCENVEFIAAIDAIQSKYDHVARENANLQNKLHSAEQMVHTLQVQVAALEGSSSEGVHSLQQLVDELNRKDISHTSQIALERQNSEVLQNRIRDLEEIQTKAAEAESQLQMLKDEIAQLLDVVSVKSDELTAESRFKNLCEEKLAQKESELKQALFDISALRDEHNGMLGQLSESKQITASLNIQLEDCQSNAHAKTKFADEAHQKLFTEYSELALQLQLVSASLEDTKASLEQTRNKVDELEEEGRKGVQAYQHLSQEKEQLEDQLAVMVGEMGTLRRKNEANKHQQKQQKEEATEAVSGADPQSLELATLKDALNVKVSQYERILEEHDRENQVWHERVDEMTLKSMQAIAQLSTELDLSRSKVAYLEAELSKRSPQAAQIEVLTNPAAGSMPSNHEGSRREVTGESNEALAEMNADQVSAINDLQQEVVELQAKTTESQTTYECELASLRTFLQESNTQIIDLQTQLSVAHQKVKDVEAESLSTTRAHKTDHLELQRQLAGKHLEVETLSADLKLQQQRSEMLTTELARQQAAAVGGHSMDSEGLALLATELRLHLLNTTTEKDKIKLARDAALERVEVLESQIDSIATLFENEQQRVRLSLEEAQATARLQLTEIDILTQRVSDLQSELAEHLEIERELEHQNGEMQLQLQELWKGVLLMDDSGDSKK
jgi:chromosome segregation ATPase